MEATDTQKPWFYESGGQRKGGFSEQEMISLITSGEITRGAVVWRNGLSDWTKLETTELAAHLDKTAPPPLSGEHVNNTVVWVLAFAPLIGLIFEAIVAGMVYNGSEYRIEQALSSAEFWYITLALNLALSFWDEKRLEQSGIDTSKFKGMTWLIPVYLYQRAKALKHNLAYFIVWLACFALMLTV